MASSSKPDLLSPPPPPPPPQQPPLKKPNETTATTTATTTTRKRKLESPNNILQPSSTSIEPDLDVSLSSSSHLTHQELLRRRLRRIHQLSKVYRDHYWAFMEDLRVNYRHYYWKFGVSPCKEENGAQNQNNNNNNNDHAKQSEKEGGDRSDCAVVNGEGCGETNSNCGANGNLNTGNNNNGLSTGGGNKLGLGFGEGGSELKLVGSNPCAFVVCKLKAMALTNFCYLHILSDPQQKLYKACNYIIKIAQQGPILCGRPILKSTVPSLCHIHFPKAQKDVKHALKKAGLNVSSSSKLAPKFHVLVAEYVHQIQGKRREALKLSKKSVVVKEETVS